MPLKINPKQHELYNISFRQLTDGWWEQEDGSVWFVWLGYCMCFNNEKPLNNSPKTFFIRKRGDVDMLGGRFRSISEPNVTVETER